MTFSTNLGVTEILCSFRLVPEEKHVKRNIPELSRLELLEKFLANNFDLSNAEDNTSGPLNRRGTADLPLLRTLLAICQKSREPSISEVIDPFILLEYAILAVSKTLLQWLLACPNFTLDSEDWIWWYKQKKWFLWVMTVAQAAENLILMISDIYINSNLNPLKKFTSSSKSTKFKVTSHGYISNDYEDHATQHENNHQLRCNPFWVWRKFNGNWDNNLIRISKCRESHCRINTSVRRNK